MDSLAETPECRYERKFVVSGVLAHELMSLIRLHPARFSEVHPPRYVNNIYFDTTAFGNYHDSTEGVARRLKVRARWYGDMLGELHRPILEFKRKQGLVGSKETHPLRDHVLNPGCDGNRIKSWVLDSNLPASNARTLARMLPLLLNRYRRSYWLSADGGYRLTIDSQMEFFAIKRYGNRFLDKRSDRVNRIVELKYGPELDDGVCRISNAFPFRMTKSSKYVVGVELLYGGDEEIPMYY